MPLYNIFYKIWKPIIDSVTYCYGAYYALAGLLTYIIVATGFDNAWYTFVAISHPLIYRIGFVSVILGMLIPILFPLALYIYGTISKRRLTQLVALAMGQAGILGVAISSFIKIFTGRLPPRTITLHPDLGGFRFGFLRGGTFNGWPSSHTTVAFAVAFALIEMYPDNKVVKIGAITFAFIIGIGVSTNIHWFSDFVAGALIGYAIGKSVGVNLNNLRAS